MPVSWQIGRRLSLVALTISLGTVSIMRPDATALAAASITVDTSHSLATVPATAIGLNTAVWDSHLLDAGVPAQIQSTGTSLLRFPGGSTADAYHWQTNSLTPGTGGYVHPANSFDAFIKNVAQPAGAGAMVTVNYGSNREGNGGGDPGEAAAWVHDANVVHHYGVKYWEIGNEVYGNGYYGGKWEEDLHSDRSPTAYAHNALGYIAAMKQADPSIKVGLVLTAPGNWPDGQGPQQWNPTVLSTACAEADFVSVHWYPQQPGSENDAGLLSSTGGIAAMVDQLRAQLTHYCGSHGTDIGVFVTESNSVAYNPGRQTTSVVNGLFLLQNYLGWMRAGVQNVTWWGLHNGPATGNNNSGGLAGTANYGDYGILSTGDGDEPPANAPFPTFTALQLLSSAMTPGATFVAATSADPTIGTFALVQPNGELAVVLINSSATATTTVSPTITGWGAVTSGTATSFGLHSPQRVATAITPINGVVTYTLAPYSAAVLLLRTGTGAARTSADSVRTAPQSPVPPTAPPSPTAIPTAIPTPIATPVQSPSLVLESFETGLDGFAGNGPVTLAGPSNWQPTVALGTTSLWVKYTIPRARAVAQLTKALITDVSAYSTLSASVFAKQPTTSASVEVRFEAQGSDHRWHDSPYVSVPTGSRTTIRWNMSGIPRSPLTMVVVCWRFTSAAHSRDNEIWFSALTATSDLHPNPTTNTPEGQGLVRERAARAV